MDFIVFWGILNTKRVFISDKTNNNYRKYGLVQRRNQS